jgi:S1-C subfamily serine protease
METKTAVREAVDRYVTVSTGKVLSSGVIITTGVVMTCFHSLSVDSETQVDGVVAEVLAVDTVHDLALLSVTTKEVSLVKLGKGALGEVVFLVGNPMGINGALLFGRVCLKSNLRVISDIHGMPGVSGSGLFNLDGELVGLNNSVIGQKHIGSWLLVALPTELMFKILGNVFRILPATAEDVEKYGQVHEEEAA